MRMPQANPSRPTTATIYAAYDQVVSQVESWVATADPRLADCDDAQVRSRVVQRVVELTMDGYVTQRAALAPGSTMTEPMLVVGRGVSIHAASGKLSVSAGEWLKNLGAFAALWGRLFAVLAASVLRPSPPQARAATLLMELPGGCEQSDAQFVRFCQRGPIEVLSSAEQLVVSARKPPSARHQPGPDYCVHPVHHVIDHFVPRSLRVAMLLRHALVPIQFLWSLLRCPVSVLLGRDAAYASVVRMLDRRGAIGAIVVTTSSFSSLPLWMKGLKGQRCKLHMVWYSQNFIPKMYPGDEKRPDLPAARHMRADVHWVWTEGFRSYLRELGQSAEIHVVGPILWYLLDEALPSSRPSVGAGALAVALFDITPVPDDRIAFGAIKNYYSVATITKFVADIVACCDEIAAATGSEVAILLKHKRLPKTGFHDSSYLRFLEEMVSSRPGFQLIDHHTNLFGLLERCQLSISVPYTSTAYVAAFLARPTIYYDPSSELVAHYERSDFIRFAAGPEQLRLAMYECLGVARDPQRAAAAGHQ